MTKKDFGDMYMDEIQWRLAVKGLYPQDVMLGLPPEGFWSRKCFKAMWYCYKQYGFPKFWRWW